jgi:hypothetical protein
MRQETEIADANEPQGKHVQEKAPQELLHRQGQEALLVGVGGVSPAKGDLVTDQRDEAMVGNGNAMGVGAQVVKDILGAPERRLAVDDPVLAEEGAEERCEGLGFCQRLEVPVEAELAVGEGTLETSDELATEDSTQDLDGEKKALAGLNPAPVIG